MKRTDFHHPPQAPADRNRPQESQERDRREKELDLEIERFHRNLASDNPFRKILAN
ncbi:MAG: hypothetical protein ACM3KM_02720 [Acidobacteriaceae bacterium]